MATLSPVSRTRYPAGDMVMGRASVPPWVLAQTLSTWGEIPASNTLDDLDADDDAAINPNGAGNPGPWRVDTSQFYKIATAWCGAAFDESTGELYWVNTGGHGDRYDNDTLKLALNLSTPAFVRVCSPSGAIGRPAVNFAAEHATLSETYSDGRHRTQHTLGMQFAWPGVGIATLHGILLANSGGAASPARPYITNPVTGELLMFGASVSANNVGGGSFAGACHDSARNVGWMKSASASNGRFARWGGPAANAWTDVGNITDLAGGISLAYCPTLDLILVGNGDNSGDAGYENTSLNQTIVGGFGIFDPVDGKLYARGVTGAEASWPTFSGAPAANTRWSTGLCPGLCQPQWAPSLGAFLAWDMSAGSTTQVMRITPPASGNPRTGTWVVDYLPVDGANAVTPSAAHFNGTYGRFFVWDRAGICGVVNASNEPGFFLKYRAV